MEFYWEAKVAWLVDLLIAHFLQPVEEWHANRSGTGDKVLRRASVTRGQLCWCQANGEASPIACDGMFITLSHVRRGKAIVSSTLCCGPAFAAWLICVSVAGKTVLFLLAPFKSGSQIKSPKPENSAWEYWAWRARQWSGYWNREFGMVYVCSSGLPVWPRWNCRFHANVLRWRDWFKHTIGPYHYSIFIKLISPLRMSHGAQCSGAEHLNTTGWIRTTLGVPAVPSVAWWGHVFSHLQGACLMIL